MSDFFDNIEVAPGVHANGKFTLGETLADYGGLQISYQAFKNAIAGKTLENKLGFTLIIIAEYFCVFFIQSKIKSAFAWTASVNF